MFQKDLKTWTVTSLGDDHDCPRPDKVSVATPAWLAKTHGEEIRLNPSISMKDLKKKLSHKHKMEFSDWQIYRTIAMAINNSDVPKQYKFLPRYGEEILYTNPGSTVKIKPRTYACQQLFERLYVCFGAMKAGFLAGCRKILMFDGCHIRTDYGGILLTAVGLDPNNGMFPIAYCVVEKERKESWLWFLEILAGDLGINEGNGHQWTVMSDKQKGLIHAVNKWIPGCEHRFCVYHLYCNFRLLHYGLSLKLLLWRAAKSTKPQDFEKVMEELRLLDKKAYDWLASKEPNQWSKAYFLTMNKTDLLTNNMSECQNKVLLKARRLPLLEMLESIRMIGMNRMVKRKEEMLRHSGLICPRIEAILLRNRDLANNFAASWNGEHEYQVSGWYQNQLWSVNIKERECSCRKWQLSGIPCAHAISSILKEGKKYENYVHDWYKKETYIKVYSHYMHPIRSQDEWPEPKVVAPDLQPPIVETQPGRPKKYKRKPAVGEKKKKVKKPIVIDGKVSRHGLIIHCSNCHMDGHNVATCPDPNKKKRKTTTDENVKIFEEQVAVEAEEDMVVAYFQTIDEDVGITKTLDDPYDADAENALMKKSKGEAPVIGKPKKKKGVDGDELVRQLQLNCRKKVTIGAGESCTWDSNMMIPINVGPKSFLNKGKESNSKVQKSPLDLVSPSSNGTPYRTRPLDELYASLPIVMSQPNLTVKGGKVAVTKQVYSQPNGGSSRDSGVFTYAPKATKKVSYLVHKRVAGLTEDHPPV